MAEPTNNRPLLKDPATRRLANVARFFGEGMLETVYPTRCAVCDKPGTLLCEACRARLPYIDQAKACARCGAAWGYLECTECNRVSLASFDIKEVPYLTCRNALAYEEDTKRIITAFKDEGEQRLAQVMAEIMAPMVSPEVRAALDAATFIPASAAAVRRRGFDHGMLLGDEVARSLGLPLVPTLMRPHTHDQRALGIRDRKANMLGAFTASPRMAVIGRRFLLVDDVMTTGSTLINASNALLEAGAREVHALTFAHAQ